MIGHNYFYIFTHKKQVEFALCKTKMLFSKMVKTWEKYSFAEWLEDGGQNHLFPDDFMERLHCFLQPYLNAVTVSKADKWTGPWDHPQTLETEADWETSKQMTRSILDRLSPLYAEIFDADFSRNEIAVTEVIPGKGSGFCTKQGIQYMRDGTINDVIYLAHEFGHSISSLLGNSGQSSCVDEWQAYFMQHAVYDALVNNREWGDEISTAVANHQRQEIIGILFLFPDHLRVLSNLKNGAIPKEEKENAEIM